MERAAVRPRYETDADLASEKAIATAWGAKYGAEPHKLPDGPRYSIDFWFTKGRVLVAVAEVKDRRGWKLEYGTIILGLSKVKALYEYHLMGIPAYFIVRLIGSVYFIRIDDRIKDWVIDRMGRTDRGDKDDMEPCYHIPMGAMTNCNFQKQ